MNSFEQRILMLIARDEGKKFSDNLLAEIEILTQYEQKVFEKIQKTSRLNGSELFSKYVETAYLITIMEVAYSKIKLDYVNQLTKTSLSAENMKEMLNKSQELKKEISIKEKSIKEMRKNLKGDTVNQLEQQAYSVILCSDELSTNRLKRDTYGLLNNQIFGQNEELSDVESRMLNSFAEGFVKERRK